jgi:hypothetical protein
MTVILGLKKKKQQLEFKKITVYITTVVKGASGFLHTYIHSPVLISSRFLQADE